jgi:hypothetical protein
MVVIAETSGKVGSHRHAACSIVRDDDLEPAPIVQSARDPVSAGHAQAESSETILSSGLEQAIEQ